MSESMAVCGEAVRQVFEFGVTGDGELDLGLDAAAARPAAEPPRPRPPRRGLRKGTPLPPVPEPGDGWEDQESVLDGWKPAILPGDGWAEQESMLDGWEPGDFEPPADDVDPETDPGDDDEAAFVAGMPPDVRESYLAGPWTGAGEVIPAGFLHHVRGGPSGAGFAAGGTLDGMEPGDWLAKALTTATADGHDRLGESELIGVMCAWRRMASWAAAGEAAAVVTLAMRRAAQSAQPGSSDLVEHVTDEIAAALTLTGRSAARLLDVAAGLGRLPAVHAALEQGRIDWPKACVFVDELAGVLDGELAGGIAARFMGRAGAGGWTTGQLRAALRRAVLAADPDAADRRKAEARKDAAVHAFGEASGNAGLAGRELPPAEVLAADARLTALAKWLQRRGAAGTISWLRAAVYTALLNGRPMESLLAELVANTGGAEAAEDANAPSADASAAAGHDVGRDAGDDVADGNAGTEADAAARAWPVVSGTIHLTMPMSTWLGRGEPGEVAGHGPVDAAASRDLATWLAASAATRWCLTVTGPDGRAAAHACARSGPATGEPVTAWAAGLRDRLGLLETGNCSHARQSRGYVPPGSLRHLIGVRQRTCAHPGCRRPAARCDLDHTVPFEKGGLTCECNLAPLCRRHHRAKQAPGWQLTQARPGEMTWRTPSGRVYQTTGDPY